MPSATSDPRRARGSVAPPDGLRARRGCACRRAKRRTAAQPCPAGGREPLPLDSLRRGNAPRRAARRRRPRSPGRQPRRPVRQPRRIDATAILPPPATEGRLQRLQVRDGAVQMHMTGTASPPPRPRTLPVPSARNYLYFYGGAIRFGKLTMTDADMQLVDADQSNPFD